MLFEYVKEPFSEPLSSIRRKSAFDKSGPVMGRESAGPDQVNGEQT